MMTAPSTRTSRWDRRRLLTGLVAVALVAVVLVAGLVYAVYSTLTSTTLRSADMSSTPGEVIGPARRPSRDEVAAEPMLQVPPADAQPTTPAAIGAPAILVPPATRTGAADVPTGFPRTPEGAVGQLAAIETTVLQVMSLPYTRQVYDRWALPGGVGADNWQMTANVHAFLETARMGQTMDLAATVAAVPAAGQVKGVDGGDWVVACVLLDVRAAITTEARMGYGYCERMQWQDTMWMIGPGTPAAQAPSTWPGSDVSVRAGWRTRVDMGQG